jgi:hypothetical protein
MFPLSVIDSVCLHLHAATANVTFHSIDRLFQLYLLTVLETVMQLYSLATEWFILPIICSEIQLNKCHPSNDLLWWKIEGWNPIWVEQYHQLPIPQGFWQLMKIGGVHMVAFAVFSLCLFCCRSWAQWVLISWQCSLNVLVLLWLDLLWCCCFCMKELMDVNWRWWAGLGDKDPTFST